MNTLEQYITKNDTHNNNQYVSTTLYNIKNTTYTLHRYFYKYSYSIIKLLPLYNTISYVLTFGRMEGS